MFERGGLDLYFMGGRLFDWRGTGPDRWILMVRIVGSAWSGSNDPDLLFWNVLCGVSLAGVFDDLIALENHSPTIDAAGDALSDDVAPSLEEFGRVLDRSWADTEFV